MIENKLKVYFELCNKWLYLKNKNMSVMSNAKLSGKSIAVYGLGKLGKRLIEELENENINIEYAIDANAESYFADFSIYQPKDALPQVDVVVVTNVCEYEQIKSELIVDDNTEVLSLRHLIEELWMEELTE